MDRPQCRKCKINYFVSPYNCDSKLYFICKMCGHMWYYDRSKGNSNDPWVRDTILLKEVAERDVGRILGKILAERGQDYIQELLKKAKEKRQIETQEMSSPTFYWE